MLDNDLLGGRMYGEIVKPVQQEVDDVILIDKLDWCYSRGKHKVVPPNKAVSRLHVIKGNRCRTFQYAYLDQAVFWRDEHGQNFMLLFGGMQPTKITVTGRNLMRVYDYITQRRWAYLKQAERDDGQDGDEISLILTLDPDGDPELPSAG